MAEPKITLALKELVQKNKTIKNVYFDEQGNHYFGAFPATDAQGKPTRGLVTQGKKLPIVANLTREQVLAGEETEVETPVVTEPDADIQAQGGPGKKNKK